MKRYSFLNISSFLRNKFNLGINLLINYIVNILFFNVNILGDKL